MNMLVHLYNDIHVAERKKGVLPFAITWMELETIMLSEIRYSAKDKCHMTSLLTGN